LEKRVKKTALALVCLSFVAFASPLRAEDHSLVRFDGGIGVIPVSNITLTDPTVTTGPVATGTRNIVRGVNPPGQIWRIDRLKADIDTDGRIRVEGRGLLLAGGNNVGLNGGQKVFATLICETAAPFTLRNTTTTGVALAPDGDFKIDDVLTPAPPAVCASPVLLIRNTGGAWFAAGILKLN
jgi:hypothetical protein